jgi:hypothetical protein
MPAVTSLLRGDDDVPGGARIAHDANHRTFPRFRGFRRLALADSIVNCKDLGLE